MKMNLPSLPRLVTALTLLGLAAFGGCTEPITVGSGLLGDDRVEVGFNGDLRIRTTTMVNDSIEMFDASSGERATRQLFGLLEDDLFGTTRRELYLTFDLIPNNAQITGVEIPPFVESDTFRLDSLVLIIPFDTSLTYGNPIGTPIQYEVFELNEPFDQETDFSSRSTLPVAATPLTSGTFTARNEETFFADPAFYTASTDSIQENHLRIPLPMSIVQRFADADSTNYASDSAFVSSVLAGLYVRPVGPSGGILNINSRNLLAGLSAYYTNTIDDDPGFYLFDTDFALASYSFDRAGSLAGSLLASNDNDATTLVEGAAGLMTRIDIANPDTLAGKIINRAELELYLDESLNYDYETFPPAEQTYLFYRDADNRRQVILDNSILPNGININNRFFFLGGELTTDEDGRRLYRINLTTHLQSIVDGISEPTIFLKTFPRTALVNDQVDFTPNRMILRGATDPEFPARLRVAFTEP